MLQFQLSFFVAICCICHVVAQRRIIGGNQVDDAEDYVFQVAIFQYVAHIFLCSGSIISSKFVLSSAHCYENFVSYPEEIYIKAGVLNIRSPGEIYDVKEIELHDFYDFDTKENDIAILVINGFFNFSERVNYITINDIILPEGAIVTISGWGKMNETANACSDQLMAVDMEVISLRKCRQSCSLESYKNLKRNIFCTAGNTGKGSCKGDSGGPAVYMDNLVGIVAGGVACAKGVPDLYVNVAEYVPWILTKCLMN